MALKYRVLSAFNNISKFEILKITYIVFRYESTTLLIRPAITRRKYIQDSDEILLVAFYLKWKDLTSGLETLLILCGEIQSIIIKLHSGKRIIIEHGEGCYAVEDIML